MMLAQQIRSAIDSSITQDEIVHIAISGDSGDALEAIDQVATEDIDYSMIDYEGIDTLDVWGSSNGRQVWRLAIRFDARREERA